MYLGFSSPYFYKVLNIWMKVTFKVPKVIGVYTVDKSLK